MVNTCKDLVPSKVGPQSPTCLISIDRTMNSLVSPPIVAKAPINENLNGTSKRLGRGAVSSGLTCECGVFAAMACGEWPTQRVSNFFLRTIIGIFFSNLNE